ncbi:villin-3 [Cajanus cajan]|uniref:villin-3 n=1 Tax=Cajanus cajan TaxID=3821 RepID=UPI0010FB6E02|nr:villin-3 [Cajanus cajan]
MTKSTPVNEEIPPLLEGGGKIEVWRINENAKIALPKEEIGKFFSGDCYIVLYTYHSGERKEDYFLCCWFGKDSNEEDQAIATRLTNTMSTSLKGKPLQGRIFEGKEPPQFVALFQQMVVLKALEQVSNHHSFGIDSIPLAWPKLSFHLIMLHPWFLALSKIEEQFVLAF